MTDSAGNWTAPSGKWPQKMTEWAQMLRTVLR